MSKSLKDRRAEALCMRIRRKAVELGFNQARLQDASGVSSQITYKIWQGRARLRDSTVKRIAEAMEVDLGEFLDDLPGEQPAVGGVRYPAKGVTREDGTGNVIADGGAFYEAEGNGDARRTGEANEAAVERLSASLGVPVGTIWRLLMDEVQKRKGE